MKVNDILKHLENTFWEDPRVCSVVMDDVYHHWNHTNDRFQYMSVVMDYASSSFNGDYVDYSSLVYVGSVINEQETNIYRTISLADSILQQMLHNVDVSDNDMVLVGPIQITPFQQQFEDVLAGAYCTVTIRVPIEIICTQE